MQTQQSQNNKPIIKFWEYQNREPTKEEKQYMTRGMLAIGILIPTSIAIGLAITRNDQIGTTIRFISYLIVNTWIYNQLKRRLNL